jgi:hypothetical protein
LGEREGLGIGGESLKEHSLTEVIKSTILSPEIQFQEVACKPTIPNLKLDGKNEELVRGKTI